MDAKVYNFDESLSEYFEFVIKGHRYKFKYPTVEEMKEGTSKPTNEETAEYFYNFITKIDDTSPNFTDVANQMTSPQLRMFTEMIKTELGRYGDNKN